MIQGRMPGSVWQFAGVERRSVLIDQAVTMLGVSRRTVYYWIRQGRLQTIRTKCGSQRVLLASIDSLHHSVGPVQTAASAARAPESYGVFGSVDS